MKAYQIEEKMYDKFNENKLKAKDFNLRILNQKFAHYFIKEITKIHAISDEEKEKKVTNWVSKNRTRRWNKNYNGKHYVNTEASTSYEKKIDLVEAKAVFKKQSLKIKFAWNESYRHFNEIGFHKMSSINNIRARSIYIKGCKVNIGDVCVLGYFNSVEEENVCDIVKIKKFMCRGKNNDIHGYYAKVEFASGHTTVVPTDALNFSDITKDEFVSIKNMLESTDISNKVLAWEIIKQSRYRASFDARNFKSESFINDLYRIYPTNTFSIIFGEEFTNKLPWLFNMFLQGNFEIFGEHTNKIMEVLHNYCGWDKLDLSIEEFHQTLINSINERNKNRTV